MADKDNIPNNEPIDYKMYLEYLDSENEPAKRRVHEQEEPERVRTAQKRASQPQKQRVQRSEQESVRQRRSGEDRRASSAQSAQRKSAPAKRSASNKPADSKSKKRKKGAKAAKSGKKPFFKRPAGIAIIVIICVLVLAIAGGLGAYYWYMNDLGTNVSSKTSDTLPIDSEDATTHGADTTELWAGDLNTAIRQWYEQDNDNWMYNNKIMNVLLIGQDDANGDNYGRSDSMILISVNTITKEIHMVSFWRDSYGMIVHSDDGKDEYVSFEKINGANVYGGPDCVVSTIEHLYKIRIDGWVMTDFTDFKKLIDAMGGVTVDVTQAESEYLAATTKAVRIGYGKDIHLNGTDALAYCRIRHLDSDIMRAERQRKVIKAIIDKAGSLSLGELTKAVKKYLPYLSTSYSKTQILTLAMKAVLGGWDEFSMSQQSAPLDTNTDSYKSGTINTAWVWVVDYPLAAIDVQNYIYGESKITLAENRVGWLQLV